MTDVEPAGASRSKRRVVSPHHSSIGKGTRPVALASRAFPARAVAWAPCARSPHRRDRSLAARAAARQPRRLVAGPAQAGGRVAFGGRDELDELFLEEVERLRELGDEGVVELLATPDALPDARELPECVRPAGAPRADAEELDEEHADRHPAEHGALAPGDAKAAAVAEAGERLGRLRAGQGLDR